MGLFDLFHEPAHRQERAELPILSALIQRYARQRPFLGQSIVFGHLLVRNSIVMIEGWPKAAPRSSLPPTRARPRRRSWKIYVAMAFRFSTSKRRRAGEWFLDVGAVLGDAWPRSGRSDPYGRPALSAHRLPGRQRTIAAKRIEGYFGTGEGFLRAWHQFPQDPLEGRRAIVFGYGKIEAAWRIACARSHASRSSRPTTLRAAPSERVLPWSAPGSAGLEQALAQAEVVMRSLAAPV
jgi:hypothetical protein